jgi:hypothetical protein
MQRTESIAARLPPGVSALLRFGAFILALILVPLVTPSHAQDSQFAFDPSGDLLLQSPEAGALPQIISQPHAQPLVVRPGGLSSFIVVLADNTGASYQWQFNSANISGATSDTLVVTNASAASQGQYSVIVDNSFGSVTSAPAMLWYDGNGDGLPDSWEMAYFGNLTNTATGDFDHDGVDNLQEFLDGTNPTNAASRLYRLTVESDGGSVQIVPNQLGYTNGQIVTLTATPTGGQPFNVWTGSVISRNTSISVVMTNDQSEFAHFQGAAFVWASASSGNWNVATNWNPGAVPGPIDDVLIDSTVTVTVTNAVECGSLTLGAGGGFPTLVCSNSMTVNSSSLWGGGTLTGPGQFLIAPGVSITISNLPNFSLNNCTLDNAGTVTWIGPAPLELTGSVITNEPGALFDCQSAATLNALTPSSFLNAGTFRKSYSTATVNDYLSFYNSGAVEVLAGTMAWNAPFTNNGTVTICAGATNRITAGGSCGGTFTATAPSLVEWTYGTFTLNPGAQLDGDGLYQINGGLDWIANTDLSVSNLNILNGTLDGTGAVTVNDYMNWAWGAMQGTGRTIISPSATLNLDPPGGVVITTRTLENAGTMTWTNAGYIQLNGAVITNDAGALFECQNAAIVNYAGTNSCRIDNAGTFVKSSSGATTFVAPIAFDNYGTLLVQAGTFWCNGTVTNYGTLSVSAGATNHFNGGGAGSGIFSAAPSSLLDWTYGNFTLNPGAQLNGDGLFAVNGFMTLIDNANVAPDYFNLFTGTLDGSGVLTVNNAMNWANATMQGPGRTVIGPGAALQISGVTSLYLTTRTLENAGTATCTGAGGIQLNGATITNRAGALFDFQTGMAMGYFGTNQCRFDNAGTLSKSVNAGTLTISSPIVLDNYGALQLQAGTILCNGPFTNNGTVTLSSGTTLQIPDGGTANGTFNTTAPSLVDWSGGTGATFTLNPGAQLNGNGSYRDDTGSGKVLDNTDLTVNNFDVFSGILDGTGALTVNSEMTWTGGTMQGTGRTVIAPGATLTITNSGFYVVNLVTRTLENDGTATWITSAGNFQLNGAVVTNAPGASFDFHNNGTLGASGTAVDRFDNAGTLSKSSSGTTTIASLISLNNYNSVLVENGILLCSGPVINNGSMTLSAGTTNYLEAGGAGSGVFTTTAPSLVDWTFGTFTLNPGAQLNGTGIFRLDGATLNGNTNLAPNNFDIISGILGGTGTLTVNTAMNWNGGTMQGTGRTVIGSGAVMKMANPGSLTLSTRTLENAGTVTWTGAGITMNSSVITNRAGAVFDCQTGAELGYGSGTCRFDNAGTLRKSVSTLTTDLGSTVPLNNYDTVQLFSGILNALGGYNSTANSLLSSRLGGTNAATGYGQLQAPGTVALNGALSVDFTNGYTPATNDSFTVLAAGGRTGAFSAFSYPSNLVTMQLTNTANAVIVRTVGVAPPPPAPLILSLALSGTNAVLRWNAVSNTTYRLQFNPDLGLSNWNAIPGDVTGLSNSASKIDALTPSNRFYRVLVMP